MAARAVSRRGGGRARPAVSVPPGRAAGPRPRASRLAPQALELLALPGGAGARAPLIHSLQQDLFIYESIIQAPYEEKIEEQASNLCKHVNDRLTDIEFLHKSITT